MSEAPVIAVKVTTEAHGKNFAILVPAIVDSDGRTTITALQAFGAAELLRSEAHPETYSRPQDFANIYHRRHKRKKVA